MSSSTTPTMPEDVQGDNRWLSMVSGVKKQDFDPHLSRILLS
jgi:hypothetical protein